MCVSFALPPPIFFHPLLLNFTKRKEYLFQLLLQAEVAGVAALLLAAVDGTGVQTSIALAADHLLAVVLHGQQTQRGLNHTTTQTEHKVKSGLLLDVVVGQSATILQLLAGEDETLLIRGDTFERRKEKEKITRDF